VPRRIFAIIRENTMDLATLEYLRDTKQLKRVAKRPPDEVSRLEAVSTHGFDDGTIGPRDRYAIFFWHGVEVLPAKNMRRSNTG
jgi:hypothetical protein